MYAFYKIHRRVVGCSSGSEGGGVAPPLGPKRGEKGKKGREKNISLLKMYPVCQDQDKLTPKEMLFVNFQLSNNAQIK